MGDFEATFFQQCCCMRADKYRLLVGSNQFSFSLRLGSRERFPLLFNVNRFQFCREFR